MLEAPPPYESCVVPANTDIPYFANRHLLKGVFMVGAGSIHTAHSRDEYVSIEDLEKSVDIFVDMALKVLAK